MKKFFLLYFYFYNQQVSASIKENIIENLKI